MHHPEDVLMGAILGIICAFITLFNTIKQSLYHTKTNIIKCRVKPLKIVEQSLNNPKSSVYVLKQDLTTTLWLVS